MEKNMNIFSLLKTKEPLVFLKAIPGYLVAWIENRSTAPLRIKYAGSAEIELPIVFNSLQQGEEPDEFLTVSQLAQRYPAFSQGSIRWLVYQSKTNGFHKVVRKIGRKVILSLREFRKFLDANSQ
jgi:hypothetical protein